MAAYIAGNGTSRENIDLSTVQSSGTLYGCNAMYLDFQPDVLVATDDLISHAIQDAGYALHNEFYTRSPYSNKGAKQLKLPYANWSSGANAVQLAVEHKHSEIYLFGFDFGSTHGGYNNCYAGNEFYKDHSHPAIYGGNFYNQVRTIIQHAKYTNFTIVAGPETKCTKSLEHLPNVTIMTINEFTIHINNVKEDTTQ